MKNYYYILGVERNATSDEIKKAYLKLVLKFHPDNNHNDKFFTKHFKEVDEAFDALFDKEKRKQYDLLMNNGQSTQPTINFTENLGIGITIPLDMVFVKGGIFMMGCADSSQPERPKHFVTLDSFWIGKYPITQAQWKAVMGNNPSHFEEDNLPVNQVSWDDTQSFIKKINRKTKKKYRLLTEAEWEYAARGGNKSKGYKYAGSDAIGEVAWYGNNSLREPTLVGQKKANELGIFDMSGNVSEWCNDWYDGDYYKNSPSKNPKGPESGSFHVIRGGSYWQQSHECFVHSRTNSRSSESSTGFRICLPE
jgi:formylglycine-generating enzyme required for sulfatase activity